MAKTLLVKSTGGAGLGDLLRSVLSGIHYAHITGRKIKVAWDDGLYGPVGENIFPLLFSIRGGLNTDETIFEPEGVSPPLWQGHLDKPFGNVYAVHRDDDWNRQWALQNMTFDQSRFDYQDSCLVMWDFDQFEASWQAAPEGARLGNSPESALREVAQRYLVLAPELVSEVESFRAAKFAPVTIGVHVRHTSETGGETRHVAISQYFRQVEKLLKRHPGAGIFLATDNSEVERQFVERFGSVTTTDKWLPTPGESLHFADGREDRFQGACEALRDMYLLGACDYLLHPANSSFSKVASLLSSLPDDRIISLSMSPNFMNRLKGLFHRKLEVG